MSSTSRTATPAGWSPPPSSATPSGSCCSSRSATSSTGGGSSRCCSRSPPSCCVGCAVAPTFPVLLAAVTLVGLTTVSGQVIAPLAGDLADPAERGRVVGTVTSGILTGILLSRTISGLVAGAFGWRAIYVAAAVLALVLAVVTWRRLPVAASEDPPALPGAHRVRVHGRCPGTRRAVVPRPGGTAVRPVHDVLDGADLPAQRAAVRVLGIGHRPVRALRPRRRGGRPAQRAPARPLLVVAGDGGRLGRRARVLRRRRAVRSVGRRRRRRDRPARRRHPVAQHPQPDPSLRRRRTRPAAGSTRPRSRRTSSPGPSAPRSPARSGRPVAGPRSRPPERRCRSSASGSGPWVGAALSCAPEPSPPPPTCRTPGTCATGAGARLSGWVEPAVP